MRERLQFIDLHRAIVILVMIEVHVFNAFMQPALRTTDWFRHLNFINGLVAPSFLFITGFVFILTTEKKIDEYRKFKSVFWKQLGRILMILLVGYSMRWNLYTIKNMVLYFSPESWADFFKVDVLHTIAIGLLILFSFRLAALSNNILKWLMVFLAVFTGIISPWIYSINFHLFLPWGLANYFNLKGGSLFPLFPWLTFIFAGGAVASFFRDVKSDPEKTRKYFNAIGLAGFIAIILGHLMFTSSSPIYIEVPQPNFFFLMARVGYVVAIFYLCWFLSTKFDFSKSTLMDVSKFSLQIYWIHLMIIYKNLWANRSLHQIIQNSLNPYECLLATGLMILIVQDMSIVWNRVKENHPVIGTYIGRAVIVLPLLFWLIFWM